MREQEDQIKQHTLNILSKTKLVVVSNDSDTVVNVVSFGRSNQSKSNPITRKSERLCEPERSITQIYLG